MRSTSSTCGITPQNVAQTTAQAVADARAALQFIANTAPGSPAHQQAMNAYNETVRLASMANSSHNPELARRAVETAHTSVTRTNNVATGRAPNAYTPYTSSGMATSYYNSTRSTGKIPSPDAPRVEEVSASDVHYCNEEKENGTIVVVTDIETLHKYNLYMGTAILMDIAQIVGSAEIALGAISAIPVSAGASAIIAFAFLEGVSMGGVQLTNDISTIIKANSDFRAGKKFKLKFTQDPLELIALGILSTEEIE